MRKRLFVLAAVIYTLLALPMLSFATAEPAVVLSPEISVTDGGESWMFSDNNRTTKRLFPEGGSLTLENSGGNVNGLYLVWDAPAPVQCTVSADGIAPVTTKGFLHEFVDLAGTTGNITLNWQGASTLCDVVALGGSDIPDWVQLWQPAEGDCDLLLLPTHADDEHLYLGGALALAAATEGCQIQVAYMVNHNGEYYRPHELLNGLWAAGVRRYPVIPDFPDVYSDSLEHAKTIYDEQEILRYQTGLINRFHPQVIVGHDLDGEYGHGAHRLNAHTLTQAVEQAAQMSDGWNTPKLYLHLYPENAILLDLDAPLEAFGGKTGFEVAQLGFAAHKSQQSFFAVEKSGPYDCRKLGLYRTAVGIDTTDDIFSNITLYVNQPPPEAPVTSSEVGLPQESQQPETPALNHAYLPQAQDAYSFAIIGSPLVLAVTAAGLLFAALLLAIIINRRH